MVGWRIGLRLRAHSPLKIQRREFLKTTLTLKRFLEISLRGIDFVDRGCFPLRGMKRRCGGKIGVIGIVGVVGTTNNTYSEAIVRSAA